MKTQFGFCNARTLTLITITFFLLAPALSIAVSILQPPPEVQKWYKAMTTPTIVASFPVHDIKLTRASAIVELRSGTLDVISSIHGHYYAVAFKGDGTFSFTPPDPIEALQLQKFTGQKLLTEGFHSAVLEFTDWTFTELLPKTTMPVDSQTNEKSDSVADAQKKILNKYQKNLVSRILRDLYSGRGGYFLASISGATKGDFIFEIDPEEREALSLKQAKNLYETDFVDVWSSHTVPGAPQNVEELDIPHFEADVKIEKNGDLEASSTLEIVPRESLQTLSLNLSPFIVVKEVTDDQGKNCFFVFDLARDKMDSPPERQDKLDIFLPDAFKQGEKRKIKIAYGSKDILEKANDSKQYQMRDTIGWYPSYGFLERVTSTITYRYPTDLELIAVGKKTKVWQEEGKNCATWEENVPVAIVCFTIGDFKHKQLTAEGLPPADVFVGKDHSGIRFGGGAVDNLATDIVNSLNYFQQLFAKYPFDGITATEIPAFHGQGFPGFLQLSGATFEDDSMTGIDEAFRAHEVSHQWWGHLVGWQSYHDQWLSEGFAEYSGALFAEAYSNQQEHTVLPKMLENWRNDILHQGSINTQRFGMPKLNRSLTMGSNAGPIWLGQRLMSSKSPLDYQILIYEKGAYVLHMLRMLMRDFNNNSDAPFFAMMRDFTETYKWKNASTEDFEKIAEKHANGKSLKWFFDEWVYGTEIPKYNFSWTVQPGPNGQSVLVCNVEQGNVSPDFRMIVPILIEFGKNRTAVARLPVDQASKTIRLNLPEKPKKVTFNYYQSVLSY